MIENTIGDRIRSVRKEHGLTQTEFGKRISITTAMVCMYENNKPRRVERTLNEICKEFGINKEWLETGQGEKYTNNDSAITPLLEKALSDNYSLLETTKISASHMDKVDWNELNEFMKGME